MSKSDANTPKKERNKTVRWVFIIFFVTIFISGTISFASDLLMASSGMLVAFVVLFAIVLVGILFDVIGVAVTSADEKPFHSMAARKVPGAQESIRLLRNADFSAESVIPLVMSALVAGLTVGGKAIGKTFAMKSCTSIVHSVGKLVWAFYHLPQKIRNRKK